MREIRIGIPADAAIVETAVMCFVAGSLIEKQPAEMKVKHPGVAGIVI